MASQARPAGGVHANGSGESPEHTSKRPSKPSDLEKGQSYLSDFSEDDTKGFDDSVAKAVSNSESEKREDQDKDDSHGGHEVVRKHWKPSKTWFILVFLGLVICWIPAILAWTKFPGARVWGVRLLFWSIWLSVLWAGWWFALVISWIWHRILLILIHFLAIYKLKRYVNWLEYLHGYIALVAWTTALWITWVPLIADQQIGNTSEQGSNNRSIRVVNLGGRLSFALAVCTAILLCEKVAVQWIAMKFHERSYKRRIEIQKAAVKAFKTVFSFVRKDPVAAPNQRSDSQKNLGRTPSQWSNLNTYRPFSDNQRHSYGLHIIDRNSTSKLQTAFTDVTGQIFGTSQLDHDDVVGRAFHRNGSKKMRKLCQHIWRGIVDDSGEVTDSRSTSSVMKKSTIEALCRDVVTQVASTDQRQLSEKIWNVLTGGLPHLQFIRKEDFESRCFDLHAEQRRLEETMNDLQNVVGCLDDLLMLFWFVGSILIFAVALEAELKTLIFGAGSAFIGASWLLRDTATEILSSIVFLFSKHPFDVDDNVVINGKDYTVKEMRLLSTVFHDDDSVQVQAPNSLLNTLFIHNLRRSPATSEPFTIEVNDQTTESQLDDFRAQMISFLQAHPQDYKAEFEVQIKGLSYQSHKMTLGMEIKYSNWESKSNVRNKRHNAWICNMRESLRLAGIQAPAIPALQVTTTPGHRSDERPEA